MARHRKASSTRVVRSLTARHAEAERYLEKLNAQKQIVELKRKLRTMRERNTL